jgi:hypothetical protein
MKKLYIFLLFACAPFFVKAGCNVQVQVQQITCFGMCDGSASAFHSGPGPYVYLWTPFGQTTSSVNNLCPGSYTVTVTDANNCTATATFNIIEPPQIIITTSPTDASCLSCCDGSIASSATGGMPGYTYLWNTTPAQTTSTAQGLCQGSYMVCVTDAMGCQQCVSESVGVSAGCSVQFSSTSPICNGDCNGSITAIPTGQSPFFYSWLPGGQTTQTINGVCAGTYTVITTDASGCTATGTITLVDPPAIVITFSTTSPSCFSCCDGSIVSSVTGGTPAYTYLWAPGGQTSPSINNLCQGTYTLCVTDMNGCMACASSTLSFSTGIADQPANGNLSVYPNPVSGFVTVKETFATPVTAQIIVTNVLGETVYTRSVAGAKELNETINMAGFTNGVYFISITTPSGRSVRKLIKE